jgi:Na+/H+ antiporter NhaC
LGIKRPNKLNCHNLKVWGVKCHILNFGGKSENRWILQGVKGNFSYMVSEFLDTTLIFFFFFFKKKKKDN